MKKLNVASILARLKGETPVFWKQVRKISVGCAALGAALFALPAGELASWMPAGLPSTLVTIGAVGTTLASLTVQDPQK